MKPLLDNFHSFLQLSLYGPNFSSGLFVKLKVTYDMPHSREAEV
jgi:hypothetical protein